MKVDRTDRIAPSRALGWLAEGVFHVLGAALMVVLVSLPLLDRFTISLIAGALSAGALELSWSKIALQAGIGVSVYAAVMLAYRSWSATRQGRAKRVIRKSRGSVMVETLAVIVPFLALTSGIAQLSILNIGAVLADIAVYQGARTVQIWHPETELGRAPSAAGASWANTVKERAKTASAVVMAPTAPNAFHIGRVETDGSNDDFRRVRSVMAGAFNRFGVPGESQRWNQAQWASFDLNVSRNIVRDTAFSVAFDQGGSAWKRASRKMTAAYMCFDKEKYEVVNTGGRVGVEFEYLHPILFPWFGYIFGEKRLTGCYGGSGTGAYGNYHVMRRNFTLPKYPTMD
jgi:hypothetical protein